MILNPRADTDEDTYIELLLYGLHSGEGYDGMFLSPLWRPDFARTFTVVDFYHLNEAGLEVPAQWMNVLADQFGFLETTFGTLYLVSGQMQHHVNLLNEFYQSVASGPQGGDDDTFDYWPGAVDMFISYVQDLEQLGNRSVTALARQLGKDKRDVPEFEDVAETLREM